MFGAAAAVGSTGCNHETLMLESWPSNNWEVWMFATVGFTWYVLLQVSFFVVFHSFWPRNGNREIQPQKINVCNLGFGQLVLGIFKGLVFHCVAAIKISAQEMKMWGFEPETWFQGLMSHSVAATGRQKIQPEKIRIWGLGLQNCFREFPGTCVLLSGRHGPPNIQPQKMRIWGLGWQNCFREFSGTCVPSSGRSQPPIHLVKANYDQRHQVTLPPQHTDELLLWPYALDGKQHAMFWLSSKNQETAPFSFFFATLAERHPFFFFPEAALWSMRPGQS